MLERYDFIIAFCGQIKVYPTHYLWSQIHACLVVPSPADYLRTFILLQPLRDLALHT